MIVESKNGSVYVDVNEIQAINRNEYMDSTNIVYNAVIHIKHNQFPIMFKTKSQLDDFINKVEDIHSKRILSTNERTLNEEFKQGIEYALKLIKKDKSEKD